MLRFRSVQSEGRAWIQIPSDLGIDLSYLGARGLTAESLRQWRQGTSVGRAGWRTLYGDVWLSIILKSIYHNKYQCLIVFWPRSPALMWSYVMSHCLVSAPSYRHCTVWMINMKQLEKVRNRKKICYWRTLICGLLLATQSLDHPLIGSYPPLLAPHVSCPGPRECQLDVSAKYRAPGSGAQQGQYS